MDIEDIANNYKQCGINEYRKGNYQEAIKLFSFAIDNKEDPAFYTNRAACYQLLRNYDLCIKDCSKIISELDPSFFKAY